MAGSGIDEETRRLCEALCSIDDAREAEAFLRDLCTTKELADFAQRLEVARLLAQGSSYAEVSRETGASSTTVSRVSKCLNGARGGYRLVLGRLRPLDGCDDGDADGAALPCSGEAPR